LLEGAGKAVRSEQAVGYPAPSNVPSCSGKNAKRVFAPDVPGIHVLGLEAKSWMAGTSPAMTMFNRRIIVTHPNDPALRSFIAVDPTSDFPIQNLPYGVFSSKDGFAPRVGVAIGEYVLDLSVLESEGLIDLAPARSVFAQASINPFMALGPKIWPQTRARISELLRHDNPELRDNGTLRQRTLVPMANAKLHLPIAVAGYTDFYSSKEHATNVGTMFRGKDNALQPNWLHMPIGYNGRASTVVVSGTKVRRPRGQLKPPNAELPSFGPCKRLDFELEMGVVVGQPSPMGEMLGESQAEEMIFGFVLLNDWSARDIQQWAARAVPGESVCDLDQSVDRHTRGAGAVPRPWPRAGSDGAAIPAASAAEQLRLGARYRFARGANERADAYLPHQF
jgi:2-keto-4-pentenoate hydratase/2-oxohepta-3-ene-1,7-dioic acid hydratase in catechol pathway